MSAVFGSEGRFPRSLIEFRSRFATGSACAEYLFQHRWPEGFVCPGCGEGRAWLLKTKAFIYECAGGGRQTSVTAGAIMHASKLPLTIWFWAEFLMATHSSGVSALQLQHQLGLGPYRTVWMLGASCAAPWSTPSASRSAAWSRPTRRSFRSAPRTIRSSCRRSSPPRAHRVPSPIPAPCERIGMPPLPILSGCLRPTEGGSRFEAHLGTAPAFRLPSKINNDVRSNPKRLPPFCIVPGFRKLWTRTVGA